MLREYGRSCPEKTTHTLLLYQLTQIVQNSTWCWCWCETGGGTAAAQPWKLHFFFLFSSDKGAEEDKGPKEGKARAKWISKCCMSSAQAEPYVWPSYLKRGQTCPSETIASAYLWGRLGRQCLHCCCIVAIGSGPLGCSGVQALQ